MRVLKFNVDAQRLTRDHTCDFTELVAGSVNYLAAQFDFSEEWKDCVIVARFWRGEKESAAYVENNTCVIPAEVLTGPTFRVSLIGQRGDYRITTNRVLVRQEVNR